MPENDPPGASEIEISLFGPGYGECIVVHTGVGEWVVIDSCLDERKQPAALAYLGRLGLDPTSVRVVVATHWHDDHVRGLSAVVCACSKAKFICASALTKREFLAMVTQYQENNLIQSGSGVNEIYKILKYLRESGRKPTYAIANRPVFRFSSVKPEAECILTALSPSDRQLEYFWEEIATLMPASAQTKRRAMAQGPNHVAVATWLTVGDERFLLGADLEETNYPDTGWSAIVASDLRPLGSARIFKIPHHGSATGYSADVWSKMAEDGAFAILTPFARGSVLLPTKEGAKKILEHTGNAYSTSHSHARSSQKRRQSIVERMIRETVGPIRTANSRFGHVRLRKNIDVDESWRVELFGNACHLRHAFS